MSEPTSIDLIRAESDRRYAADPRAFPNAAEFDEHLQTYRIFLRWVALFVAHVAVILALLAFFLVR